MPGQHFSPFFIAFGIILQHSLSKDFGALHRYYLITVCRGMKCFSQGQSATHGRVCVISLRSHQCRKDSSPFPGGSERMLSAHPDLFCRGEGKRQLLLLQVLWSSGALWEPLKEQGTTDEHQWTSWWGWHQWEQVCCWSRILLSRLYCPLYPVCSLPPLFAPFSVPHDSHFLTPVKRTGKHQQPCALLDSACKQWWNLLRWMYLECFSVKNWWFKGIKMFCANTWGLMCSGELWKHFASKIPKSFILTLPFCMKVIL